MFPFSQKLVPTYNFFLSEAALKNFWPVLKLFCMANKTLNKEKQKQKVVFCTRQNKNLRGFYF